MTTREENLKKINAELEKMSDEELDEVAGGTWREYCQLGARIEKVGGDVYSVSEVTDWLNENLHIKANISIGHLFSDGDANTYYNTREYDIVKTGPGSILATFKKLSHEQVLKMIDDWGKAHKK